MKKCGHTLLGCMSYISIICTLQEHAIGTMLFTLWFRRCAAVSERTHNCDLCQGCQGKPPLPVTHHTVAGFAMIERMLVTGQQLLLSLSCGCAARGNRLARGEPKVSGCLGQVTTDPPPDHLASCVWQHSHSSESASAASSCYTCCFHAHTALSVISKLFDGQNASGSNPFNAHHM